jgi:two-component system cell cycle sensor histidine kinase/response regulator CckA
MARKIRRLEIFRQLIATMNVATQFSREYDRDLRFRAMFEAAVIGIGICSVDGRVVEANPALAKMLGSSQQELEGTYAWELSRRTCCETDSKNATEVYPGKSSRYEHGLRELIGGERQSFEIDKYYRRKDGSDLWGHLTLSLARDSSSRTSFLVIELVDASESKRVMEYLREAEKMEIIGRLAAGVAHDFNNLLTGILLYCDLSIAGLSAGLDRSELSQHVREVRMAGEQGAALTHQLLAIARKQMVESRPVRINEIVASTTNLLRRLLGKEIELVVSLSSTLNSSRNSHTGLVLADPASLRQVLLNLVLNARDAMPRGGKIVVTTRPTEYPGVEPDSISQKDSFKDYESAKKRHAVALLVEDNGCGMDDETQTRLFEPFFTTKRLGEGTGLGLATVQRIVGEAGGVIAVKSAPGEGTSIEVFLPEIESPIESSI